MRVRICSYANTQLLLPYQSHPARAGFATCDFRNQPRPGGVFGSPPQLGISRAPEASVGGPTLRAAGGTALAPQHRGGQNGSLSQSFPAQQQARASASSSPSEPVGMFRGLGTSPYPLGLGSGWSWTYVGGFWVSVAGLEESRVAELASKPRFHADLLATLRSQDAGFERAKRPVEPWAWRGVGED